MSNWKFTTIHHATRIEMGLTLNEYAVYDIIYRSQTHPDYHKDGWAENSYRELSSFLGMTKGAVHGIIDRGVERGFLEVNPANPRQKKTTEQWYNKAYLEGAEVKRSENERSENERKINKSVQKMNATVQKMNAINKDKLNTNSIKDKEQTAPKVAPPTESEKAVFEQLKLKAEKVTSKKVAPKKVFPTSDEELTPVKKLRKEPTLHSKAKTRFEYWQQIHNPEAAPIYWDKKEIGQLTNMLNRLKDAAKKKKVKWQSDDQFISEVFDVFCKKFIESGQWYADCFVPSSIVSKWNIIIQTLNQNGRNKRDPNKPVTSREQQRRVLEQLIEEDCLGG